MFFYNGKLLVLSALARAMTKVGYQVHVSHVSRVLRGQRVATKDFVRALSTALGLTIPQAQKFINDTIRAAQDFEQIPKVLEE